MKMTWPRLKNRYYQRLLRRKDLPEAIRDYLQAFQCLDFDKPITETEFVIFDTETTGLDVKKGNRIVSISGLRLKQGRIDLSDVFHETVNPNRDIPSAAAVVHEILPRMVNGKPTIEEILPNFIRYIGASVLVAHHEWLDMSFLNREMVRLYGIPIQNVVLDTVVLERALIAKKRPASMITTVNIDSTLGAVAERYHVTVEELHSSFWDALATGQIFQQMIKEVQRLGIVNLRELLKFARRRPAGGFFKSNISSA